MRIMGIARTLAGPPRRTPLRIAERTGGAAAEMSARKVLIVDDDRSTVFAVRNALAPQGYRFYDASDGSQALSALRQHRPDLVLMDVEMPGLSGVEVCRIIKANQSETAFGFIPVILMTARQQAGKIEGLELGADDFLIKPIDLLELCARVKSMLRLKMLQDALLENNRELHRANKELDKKRLELLALARTDALTGQAIVGGGPGWDVLQEVADDRRSAIIFAFKSDPIGGRTLVRPRNLEGDAEYAVYSVDAGFLGTALGSALMQDGIELVHDGGSAAHILTLRARP